jgi:peptide/bleomycin uptake transporter
MFRSYFLSREWFPWAWPGMAFILFGTWFLVQLTADINEWHGAFGDMLQNALGAPNSVTEDEYLGLILEFLSIAMRYVAFAVFLSFFTKHWVFRWRQAMNNFYMYHWAKLRHVEGASQRVQEDTKRFAQIMEGLGSNFVDSIMTLIVFLPILWELSKHVTVLPWIGEVDHALIYVAILSAASGTVLLAAVGIKLPGLEFNNQMVEAAYRKELVYGEDHENRAAPPTVMELFGNVRRNYFRLFFHYMYFDVFRFSYLQFSVIIPYIALMPTVLSASISLGILNRIVNAFNRVEASFQYLVFSWSTIVELISVYKRLRKFEAEIYRVDRVEQPAE